MKNFRIGSTWLLYSPTSAGVLKKRFALKSVLNFQLALTATSCTSASSFNFVSHSTLKPLKGFSSGFCL